MKNISNNYPEWNAKGSEPDQAKKDEGWQAGEKPPADWFNWLFNKGKQSFEDIDQGIADRLADVLTEGVLTGGDVTENSTPDLSVIVEALTGFNADGARINLESNQTVDLSSYLPTTAGNEKYVSIYIDVVDLETNTEINIDEGTSATAGNAVKPAIDNTQGVLLADVLLTEGKTSIGNDNIELIRTEECKINLKSNNESTSASFSFTAVEAGERQLFNVPNNFNKLTNEPIINHSDITWTSEQLIWPCIIKAGDFIDSPLGAYYIYYSTDHSNGDGGIGLAYSNDLTGPWTDYSSNPVYQDTTTPGHTETATVIWNEKTQEFYMYYHDDENTLGNRQSTFLATSTDGLTWARQGKIIDTDVQSDYFGDGHTGYTRIQKVGNLFVAHHLQGGGGLPVFGISYSYDGINFINDPRPLMPQQAHLIDSSYRIEMRPHIINWKGELWGISAKKHWDGAENTKIVVFKMSDDLRRIISPPQDLIKSEYSFEAGGVILSYPFYEDGRLYLIYESSDGAGDQHIGIGEII